MPLASRKQHPGHLAHELPSRCHCMMLKLLFGVLVHPKIQHAKVPNAFRLIRSIFIMYTVTLPLTRATVIQALQHQHVACTFAALLLAKAERSGKKIPGSPQGL